MARLMVIDDSAANLALLSSMLQPEHEVRAVTSAERALQLLQRPGLPELILLDLMLEGLDGFEFLRRIKAEAAWAEIPVIIVTAVSDSEAEERGLALGAVDYLTKPLRPRAVLARVRQQLKLCAAERELRQRNQCLETEVQRRMGENLRIQDACILALGSLAETRDPETGNHLKRVQATMRLLCELLRERPRFAAALGDEQIELLVKSAPLHDIGKVGIPDHILLKPGPLSADEWVVMRRHCEFGAAAIARAQRSASEPLAFLHAAHDIALYHHERWDGSGYPHGLRGERIPVAARLMALTDVFDALMSQRPYKPALPPEVVRATILRGRGAHFDPEVADVFLDHFDEFVSITRGLADLPAEGLRLAPRLDPALARVPALAQAAGRGNMVGAALTLV